jgi:superfamily II DNA or RNA helicase
MKLPQGSFVIHSQYIGRIERGESGVKRVYDYRDTHIAQLESMFKKRQRHYNRRKRE